MEFILFGMNMWRWATLLGVVYSVAYLVSKQTWSLIGKLTALWFAISAAWVLLYIPNGPMSAMDLACRIGAARVLLVVLLVPMVISGLSGTSIARARAGLFGFFLVCAAYRVRGGTLWVGTTQDNLMLAVTLPYFLHWYGRWAWLLMTPIVWAAMTHAGLVSKEVNRFYDIGQGAVVVLVVHLILLGVFKRRVMALVSAGVAIGVALWSLPLSGFSFMTARYDLWNQFIRYWQEKANPWIGFGPGSFEWMSVGVAGFKWKWTWMHSDWAQVWWESGWIGLTLVVLFYLFLLWKVRREYYKFTTLAGVGLAGLVYSPVQFVWTWVLVGSVMREKT